METAAQAITAILARSGLKKSELAARSGVSRALLDDYLKGRRQPAITQLERLGAAAGLHLDIRWSASDERECRPTPRWATPNPLMEAQPLTVEQRATVIELVCGMAMELPARRRDKLEFPPFRTLVRQ